MKIGFVLDDGLDKKDGVQQYILALGDWYKKNGYEVRYLVGETHRKDIDGVYSMAKNLKVKFNGNKLTIPFPTSKKAIKKVLDNEQFDVLHLQTPHSPFFGAKVVNCADKKTAIVATFHIMPYGVLSSLGTYALGIWLRKSLRRIDAMVSVSAPAAEFSKKTFKLDSEIVPNSVQIEKFKPKKKIKPNKNLKIMFLGRLVHRKGCKQLLLAVNQLNNQDKLPTNLVIDICGDGEMRSELEKFVKDNGLSKVVNFHGFVTDDEKIEFMQQADISIFPSLSGESFGIVLIEAMAAGSRVVLGGNNPGYASVLAEIPESIMDVHNIDNFAEQLHEIINDEKLQQRINKAQQKHVEQFDTSIVAKKLLSLYEACKIKNASR